MTDYSDAAKRVASSMTVHALAGSAWKWAAFRLSDGTPLSNAAYDTRRQAMLAARWNVDLYMYLEIQPDGMSEELAENQLRFARDLHDAGVRISPDWEFDLSMPMFEWDRRSTIKELARGR